MYRAQVIKGFFRCISRLKTERWSILLMLAIGTLYGSHHYFLSRALAHEGRSYTPITVEGRRDDMLCYVPRAKAFFDGRWILGDVSLAEHRGDPSALSMINPWILGGLGKIVGSFERGLILADILFPMGIFASVYTLALELFRRRWLARAFAFFFMLKPTALLSWPAPTVSGVKDWFATFFFVDPSPHELFFSRIEYPKLTFIFYALTVVFLLKALRERTRIWTWLAGFGFGILFYSYFYDWTVIATWMALMGIWLVIQKDWQSVKILLTIFGIGVIISLQYWWNVFQVSHLSSYQDVLLRMDVEFGRFFRWKTVLVMYAKIGILSILLRGFSDRSNRLETLFLISGLCTYVVVVNVQLLTTFNPQPDHWLRTQFLIFSLSVCWLAYVCLHRYEFIVKKWVKVGSVALGSVLFICGMYSQARFQPEVARAYAVDQPLMASVDWMREHIPSTATIGALSIESNALLALYGRNHLFLPNGFTSVASNEEIWTRVQIMADYFGLSGAEFKRYVQDGQIYFFTVYYRDHGPDRSFFSRPMSIPEDVLEEAQRRFETVQSRPRDMVKPFQLDYIFVRNDDMQFGQKTPEALKMLTAVYHHDGIAIYRVPHNVFR